MSRTKHNLKLATDNLSTSEIESLPHQRIYAFEAEVQLAPFDKSADRNDIILHYHIIIIIILVWRTCCCCCWVVVVLDDEDLFILRYLVLFRAKTATTTYVRILINAGAT